MRSAKSLFAFVAQWHDLEKSLLSSQQHDSPVIIDSALDPSKPTYSDQRPTLFRERHGWCPYSERVWLALESSNVPYDTIRIDNTGPGRKPPYFAGGLTPQMRWPDGENQGESMDLVQEVDARYGGNLYPHSIKNDVINKARMFQTIFPSKSRPSSRAAFLFDWSGDPLWKSEFESVLSQTDELIGTSDDGPFFCGESFTAADISWVPFLERYSAQLPCLHEGLDPRDATKYPNLNKWFEAMNNVPAYACRVRGNPSSWRKVLTMAGYGNGGVPPSVIERIDGLGIEESRPQTEEERIRDQALWDEYKSTRPYLADTPSAEAGKVILSNRDAIIKDTLKRAATLEGTGIPLDEKGLDEGMRALASILIYGAEEDGHYEEMEVTSKDARDVTGVFAIAKFLDERMCVPRDMGAMSADAIKRLSVY
mmetsp:Transcript_21470/g.46649  ORF Transcript_21470/g.46649 Transcript_21470/m.46649 type:complete len:424 (+) Transcript_21470:129-1400(+)